MLKDRHIVLGVTGGIAAYKACEIVSRLTKAGAQVRVVMTNGACQFVRPAAFEALSGCRAHLSAFEHPEAIDHIALARWAHALLVAPATANILAKFRMGLADDLLSALFLATTAPVFLAPAMNARMWAHPATQENVSMLAGRGAVLIGPEGGHLACGDDGPGRMSEPEAIVARLDAYFSGKRDFEGVRVLVTAGPTVERIDPVRYITNRSSGKMGYALAEAARARGAQAVLVSGPTRLAAPAGVERVDIESSDELCREVLSRAEWADVVLQAAAPADFTPETPADAKIKKGAEAMTLRLRATTDIARELGRRKRDGQTLVAFAAETNDVLENAKEKLRKKNADLIVANDVTAAGAGFAGDTNIVTLIDARGAKALPLLSKRAVADAILDAVVQLRKERS